MLATWRSSTGRDADAFVGRRSVRLLVTIYYISTAWMMTSCADMRIMQFTCVNRCSTPAYHSAASFLWIARVRLPSDQGAVQQPKSAKISNYHVQKSLRCGESTDDGHGRSTDRPRPPGASLEEILELLDHRFLYRFGAKRCRARSCETRPSSTSQSRSPRSGHHDRTPPRPHSITEITILRRFNSYSPTKIPLSQNAQVSQRLLYGVPRRLVDTFSNWKSSRVRVES
jgi:hypothetical protein